MVTERERGFVQRQKNFILLDMTLQQLAEAPTKAYDEQFLQELNRRVGSMLWPAIPIDVTELDLGNIKILRDQTQVGTILPQQRKTWDLPQVDQYAATVARTIGKPYTPKFPPLQGHK